MKVIVTTITRSPRGNPMRASREINAEQLRIGRGAECELRLADPRVPLHAKNIFMGKSGPQLYDSFEQHTDVTVTGVHRPQTLKPGSSLRIGPFLLEVAEPHHDADLALTVELVQPLPGKSSLSAEELSAATRQTLISKRMLSWTLFLLVVAGFLLLPLFGPGGADAPRAASRDGRLLQKVSQGVGGTARHSWNPGELAAGHQPFAGNCEACHSEAFTRVQDKDCKACHQNLGDHVDREAKVAGLDEVRCASCHQDHQGTRGLEDQNTHFAMGECSACHRDIKAHLPATPTGDAGDFATQHPEFRSMVVTGTKPGGRLPQVARMRLSEKAGLIEKRGLKFPHDLHLDPKGVKGPQGLVKTTCASCHVPDSTGRSFRPVTMKDNCQSCHELRFELAAPERQVPHGNVDEVMATMREFYSYLAVNGIVLNPAPLPSARAIPGKSAPAPLRLSGGGDVDRQVTLAATEIFEKTTCFACHDITRHDSADGRPAWRVNPVLQAVPWMPRARFSHDSHDMTSCSTCHAAPVSKQARDVLMPGIETCRACHAGSAPESRKVTSNCGLCHGFHQTTHPAVTPHAGPAWPSSRDAALLQSAAPLPPARLP